MKACMMPNCSHPELCEGRACLCALLVARGPRVASPVHWPVCMQGGVLDQQPKSRRMTESSCCAVTWAFCACLCPMISVLFVQSGQAGPLPTHSWLLPLHVLCAVSHGSPVSKQKVPRMLGVVSAAAGRHSSRVSSSSSSGSGLQGHKAAVNVQACVQACTTPLQRMGKRGCSS